MRLLSKNKYYVTEIKIWIERFLDNQHFAMYY